ncbi:MAG: hypothetical protein MI923_01530 [Phycisphaerales bacterium]|nr:hypothetical protein [Phycisphaerales bacterium]
MILRPFALALLTLLLFGQTVGCSDTDWNWDLEWWKKPSRIVRPNQTASPTLADRHQTPPAETKGQDNRMAHNPVSRNSPAVPNASNSVVSSRRDTRPFFHLYLVSGDQASSAPPDEYHFHLRNIDARSCARLVEMLYVPLGRSGSVEETYLLFEERDEFNAAKRGAAMLDIRSHSEPAVTANDGMSFETGIAFFYEIISQGAIVDRGLIDKCGKHLTTAVKSPELSDTKRWAAAILAGRLLSEFRYDYVAARRYYEHAQRVAKPDSIEQMVVEWWHADSLIQEGSIRKGNKVYEDLLDTYTQQWPRSQIVTRSSAILKENRKRG